MSGTRSPSPKGPATDERPGRWPVWRLAVLFYPLAAGAVAINLFLLGLLGQVVGLQALAPLTALIAAIPLGAPASWWFAGRMRALMDEADRDE